MKKKILSLVLALTLCLGVAVPTFAAGTETYTVDGITITIDSSGTISYTGSGTLTGYTAEGGIMMESIRSPSVLGPASPLMTISLMAWTC